MTVRRIVASLFIALALALAGCGGDNGDCELVCSKSEECGGAPANCMESCESDPPSGDCLACYEEESCADVGRCLTSCG